MRFLDSNVILRYLANDDEAKARDCYELLQRAQRGEEEREGCEEIVSFDRDFDRVPSVRRAEP